MGGNDEAVAFVQEQRPTGIDVELIARALDCRRAAADPDMLIAARAVLPCHVEACRALIASDNQAA
jgi:hypothetical protein